MARFINFPSRYLQDYQQIHDVNRLTKQSEAKNFSGSIEKYILCDDKFCFIFNELCIKNALTNTGEFSAGEYFAREFTTW